MNIKENNYITILGWMRTKLDLVGNELLTYALLYGFSQDGNNSFSGTRQYIADFVGVSTRQISNILSSLIDKGLIVKFEEQLLHGKQKLISYRALYPKMENGTTIPKEVLNYDWLNN